MAWAVRKTAFSASGESENFSSDDAELAPGAEIIAPPVKRSPNFIRTCGFERRVRILRDKGFCKLGDLSLGFAICRVSGKIAR